MDPEKRLTARAPRPQRRKRRQMRRRHVRSLHPAPAFAPAAPHSITACFAGSKHTMQASFPKRSLSCPNALDPACRAPAPERAKPRTRPDTSKPDGPSRKRPPIVPGCRRQRPVDAVRTADRAAPGRDGGCEASSGKITPRSGVRSTRSPDAGQAATIPPADTAAPHTDRRRTAARTGNGRSRNDDRQHRDNNRCTD